MNAYDSPTAHSHGGTAFELATTGWTPPEPAGGQPASKPQAPPAPTEPMPDDKWGMVQMFADRVTKAVEIERDIKNLMDRRQSLGRRVIDAAKRHDDDMAQRSTAEWLQTEAQLQQLFDAYAPLMQEREQTLSMLGIR